MSDYASAAVTLTRSEVLQITGWTRWMLQRANLPHARLPDGGYQYDAIGVYLALGVDQAAAEREVERIWFRQLAEAHGAEHARSVVYGNVATLDDKGYHPTQIDPLLRGVARATGDTARAVKSRRALTLSDMSRSDAGEASKTTKTTKKAGD